MKITNEQLRQIIKEELEYVLEEIETVSENKYSNALSSAADYAIGLAFWSVAAGTLAAGISIPKYLYNKKKDAVVTELEKMSAIQIEAKLNQDLPAGFKAALEKEGISTSDLAIQIEKMNPEQIEQALNKKIQYEIDYEPDMRMSSKQQRHKAQRAHQKGEPVQSDTYRLGDPLTVPSYYPPFKYDK